MFITHQSVGLSDASREPTGCIPSCVPASVAGLVWEIDCSRCTIQEVVVIRVTVELCSFNLRVVFRCRAGKGSVARQAACSQVQSKPSRTQTRRQLGCSPPGTLNADVAEVSDPEIVGDAGQPVQRELNQPDGRPVPRDPNVAGFVPAFILGKVYLCKVPERQVLASKPCKQATGAHKGSNVTSSQKPLCAFYASPCTLRAVLFALTCLLEVHTCEVLSYAEAARASQ